jgi:hypothetical protein
MSRSDAMTWEAIGALAELFGAAAVVASLRCYHGILLRSESRATGGRRAALRVACVGPGA